MTSPLEHLGLAAGLGAPLSPLGSSQLLGAAPGAAEALQLGQGAGGSSAAPPEALSAPPPPAAATLDPPVAMPPAQELAAAPSPSGKKVVRSKEQFHEVGGCRGGAWLAVGVWGSSGQAMATPSASSRVAGFMPNLAERCPLPWRRPPQLWLRFMASRGLDASVSPRCGSRRYMRCALAPARCPPPPLPLRPILPPMPACPPRRAAPDVQPPAGGAGVGEAAGGRASDGRAAAWRPPGRSGGCSRTRRWGALHHQLAALRRSFPLHTTNPPSRWTCSSCSAW